MWYSTVTDMDFCLIHGKSHDHRGFYLVPYNGVLVNGTVVSDGYFTNERIDSVEDNASGELSRKDLFLDKLSNFSFWSI